MIEPHPQTPGTIDREIPSSLNQLYQEVILDHYRKPRNKGHLDGATHAITMNNPLCGDVIELMLRVEGGSIAEARFLGRGCSISLASASMLTGRVRGKSLEQALELSRKFTHLLHGDGAMLSDDDLGDLRRGCLTVEIGRDEFVLVELFVTHGLLASSLRRCRVSWWFPPLALIVSASRARPRAILDLTVPGGIRRICPISA